MAGNRNRNWSADADYAAKLDHETSRLARRSRRPGNPGEPSLPTGDPGSGVLLVAESPTSPPKPRVVEALNRSLDAVGLSRAYVTWSSSGALAEELRALDPPVVVACGPGGGPRHRRSRLPARLPDVLRSPGRRVVFLDQRGRRPAATGPGSRPWTTRKRRCVSGRHSGFFAGSNPTETRLR